jgi:hypothetical protein
MACWSPTGLARALPVLLCGALLGARARADADVPPGERALDPGRVRGVSRPAIAPGDAQRTLASGLLFLPREMVELLFLASGTAASLIRDEQVVPRVEDLLSPRPGNISVFPTLFLDTRRRTSVGAQLLAAGYESATRLAFGFGGVHDLVGEARLHLGLPLPLPVALSLEGLADERSTLDYIGVGQEPDTDPRNRFRAGAATHDALYEEQRVRAIVGAGLRPTANTEILLSASFTRSRVEDTPGGGPSTLSRVFVPGSVPGAPGFGLPSCPDRAGVAACPEESRIVYAELALRLDTRPTVAKPSPGILVEGYGGYAFGTGDDPTRLVRLGGRAAIFVPVLRATNILSPRIILDGLATPGDAQVPFTALTSQPDFRGIDDRIDRLSLVASLDYRWSVIEYVGARVFLDMATVGPDVGSMLNAPKRFAGGFGVDVYSGSTELAQMMVSLSSEGARAFFTFGVPPPFGDRQHRR